MTVKELSTRLDELTKTFQNDLAKFKEEVVNIAPNPTVRNEIVSDNFLKRFQQFEAKVNNDIIKIKQEIQTLSNAQKNLGDMERCLQQNNNKKLLIHGIDDAEMDPYDSVIDIINNKMDIRLDKKDISCCYRLGQKNKEKKRPVLIEFGQQWRRDMVYYNKAKLKGSSLLITEVLTQSTQEWFKQCYNKFKNNCWTSYGKIFVLCNGKKTAITNQFQLNNILK